MRGDERRLERELASAREALEAGRTAKAVRDAWMAARSAALLNDEPHLEAMIALATEIRDRASGRDRDEAEQLASYCSHCLADAQTGIRRGGSLARLLDLVAPEPVKRCPDCAETIKAAANVCRFCGYRFETTSPEA